MVTWDSGCEGRGTRRYDAGCRDEGRGEQVPVVALCGAFVAGFGAVDLRLQEATGVCVLFCVVLCEADYTMHGAINRAGSSCEQHT